MLPGGCMPYEFQMQGDLVISIVFCWFDFLWDIYIHQQVVFDSGSLCHTGTSGMPGLLATFAGCLLQ